MRCLQPAEKGTESEARSLLGDLDPLTSANPAAPAWVSDPMQAPWLQKARGGGQCTDAQCRRENREVRRCGNVQRLITVLVLNMLYTMAELACFYYYDSLTMLIDAFHNLSDVIAVGIALQCERLKRRPDAASLAYLTFGAKRFEVVGGFANGVLLLALSLYVALDSIPRLLRPIIIDGSPEWVAVAAIGVPLNLVSAALLTLCGGTATVSHAHSHGDNGECAATPADGRNLNMYAVVIHTLGDALTSVFVTATASLILYKGKEHLIGSCSNGYLVSEKDWHGGGAAGDSAEAGEARLVRGEELAQYCGGGKDWIDLVDPAVSLVLSLMVGAAVVPLLRKALPILLDACPAHISVSNLRAQLGQLHGVAGVGALHVWMVDDGNAVAGVVHLFVDTAPPPVADPYACGFVSPRSKTKGNNSIGHLGGQVSDCGHSQDGLCDDVRRRALGILAAGGVEHSTVQTVPLRGVGPGGSPGDRLSSAHIEIRAAYLDQAGQTTAHWSRQWAAANTVPLSLRGGGGLAVANGGVVGVNKGRGSMAPGSFAGGGSRLPPPPPAVITGTSVEQPGLARPGRRGPVYDDRDEDHGYL